MLTTFNYMRRTIPAATPGDQVETSRRLTDCIGEVRRWMALHMLKLNDEKLR